MAAARRSSFPSTLVISGGGMKGVASLGAVVALKKAGVLSHVHTVVGTSAGALIAAALATNRAKMSLVDELAATAYEPDIDLAHVRTGFGLDSGRHLDTWIRKVLGGGEVRTFRNVLDAHGMRLVVCATNVSQRRAVYFGPETHPDMDVALALRMSCSVPLYFSAVRHRGDLFVDGGVSDNFPVEWAARQCPEPETVLGIAFAARASAPARSLEAYVSALVECSTRRQYPCDLENPPDTRAALYHPSRCITLHTGATSAFDFGMPPDRLRALYASGARQARAWVKKHV